MSGKWHGGKGSRPRPFGVPIETFDENMDRIFNSEEKAAEAERKRKEKQEYFAKLALETQARLEQQNKKD
jgi:hypothetical protein